MSGAALSVIGGLATAATTVAIAHAAGIDLHAPPSRHLARASAQSAGSRRAGDSARTSAHAAQTQRAERGARGARGVAGVAGIEGVEGPAGPMGPPGQDGILNQTISINWQNGDYRGRDSASFVAPGIGRGEVVCSMDTQWINFTPYDQGADTEMWGAIMRGEEVSVRAAARRAPSWGDQFNLDLNQVSGPEPESQGSMIGIISSRGQFGSAGEQGPPPTTFHLAWYWSFADPYGPRCYVAGTFETGR
jgi:hypothetical protein